jgi:hypothetical protein
VGEGLAMPFRIFHVSHKAHNTFYTVASGEAIPGYVFRNESRIHGYVFLQRQS